MEPETVKKFQEALGRQAEDADPRGLRPSLDTLYLQLKETQARGEEIGRAMLHLERYVDYLHDFLAEVHPDGGRIMDRGAHAAQERGGFATRAPSDG